MIVYSESSLYKALELYTSSVTSSHIAANALGVLHFAYRVCDTTAPYGLMC